MALIDSWTPCAICQGLLDRAFTATSGVAFPPGHRLYEYCDAPLHLDCLATWPDREEFSRGYFLRALAYDWRGGGVVLKATPRWFLGCGGPAEAIPEFVTLYLRDWPFRLSSSCSEWMPFVEGGYRDDFVGPALDAVTEVMAEVRLVVPTRAALEGLSPASMVPTPPRRSYVEFGKFLATLWGDEASETDWGLLDVAERADEEYRAEKERARARAIVESNALAQQLLLELEIRGRLLCPRCHEHAHRIRFVERSAEEKSYFICRTCGCSFAGDETSKSVDS